MEILEYKQLIIVLTCDLLSSSRAGWVDPSISFSVIRKSLSSSVFFCISLKTEVSFSLNKEQNKKQANRKFTSRQSVSMHFYFSAFYI